MTSLVLITAVLTSGLTGDARDVMEPVVRVKAPNSLGSGVVIESVAPGVFGGGYTRILTNYHVISGALGTRFAGNGPLDDAFYVEIRKPVEVQRFIYKDGGRTVEIKTYPAEIRAYSKEWDLALLEVRGEGDWPAACLFPEDEPPLTLLEPVWAVGCALGKDPICTIGHIMDLDEGIEGLPFILVSSQIIYGNSGGAAFVKRAGVLYLVGIPSRIRLLGNGIPLPYMGLVIPPERVRAFLQAGKG